MPYANYKKANIYYEVQGKGRAIILLHGFLECLNMWSYMADHLSKQYKVITIDLPGHGKSDCIGYVHTMNDMAHTVHEIVKKENIRKATLIGHSMGGYVSLAFADLYPDNIKAICLFFSTSRPDNKEKKISRNQAIELVKQNHKSFVRKAFPMLFRSKYRSLRKETIKQAKTDALSTSKQGIIAALEGMKTRKSREVLLKFPPYPIHFISGKKDPVIPSKTIEEQLTRSERVTGIILSEPGHMGHIETPELCLTEIRSFLSSTRLNH